ncbi:MAG TPA: GNAT family N-acetyltransferase [Candidatus Saccharimonadaceae bacterium]|nr:GNAT family N-acetyltransferase [Candidatus Saccharimonadaceae bacterium]
MNHLDVAGERQPNLHTGTVRERIDPDGTLPKLRIDTYRDDDDRVTYGMRRVRWRLLPETAEGWPPIGHCSVVFEESDHSAHFDGVEIDVDQRGKGIGMALYVAAIDFARAEGYSFVTQRAGQSEDAKHIWEFLAEKGIARVEEEFHKYDRLVAGKKKFYGKYIIDADSSTIEE